MFVSHALLRFKSNLVTFCIDYNCLFEEAHKYKITYNNAIIIKSVDSSFALPFGTHVIYTELGLDSLFSVRGPPSFPLLVGTRALGDDGGFRLVHVLF